MPRPKRPIGPLLAPDERRREVVAILSKCLACMPLALALPPTDGPEDSPESSTFSP